MKQIYKAVLFALCLILTFGVSRAENYDFEQDGIYYKVLSLSDLTVQVTGANVGSTGEVTIPATVDYNGKTLNVTTIGKKAFDHVASLKKINIPEGITQIDNSAFYSCKGLEEIHLPSTLETLGSNVFYSSGIVELKLPVNVNTIGSGLCNNCDNLKSVVLSDKISEIPLNAFKDCDRLESVTFGKAIEQIESHAFSLCNRLETVILPPNVVLISGSAFSQCERLSTVILPENLETIGGHVFSKCVSLKQIVIPDKTEFVNGSFVDGCTALTKITFGKKLREISGNSINKGNTCTALKELEFRGTTPPECPAFDAKQYMDLKILVPAEAVDAYKSATPWKDFWNIEAVGASSVDAISVEKPVVVVNGSIHIAEEQAAHGVEVFNINGVRVYNGNGTTVSDLDKGMYVVKAGNTTHKVAIF